MSLIPNSNGSALGAPGAAGSNAIASPLAATATHCAPPGTHATPVSEWPASIGWLDADAGVAGSNVTTFPEPSTLTHRDVSGHARPVGGTVSIVAGGGPVGGGGGSNVIVPPPAVTATQTASDGQLTAAIADPWPPGSPARGPCQ